MKELKLSHVAGIVSATGIIGAAILYIGSLFFQTNEKAEQCNVKVDAKIAVVEQRTEDVEKAFIETKSDLKYIRQDLRDIKKKIK